MLLQEIIDASHSKLLLLGWWLVFLEKRCLTDLGGRKLLGAIDGMGAAISGGMVFILSGNNGAARVGSNGVNVLLAYSVDGK